MVLVPIGCFQLGISAASIQAQPLCFDEPFWIDRYEVTQTQYDRFDGLAERTPSNTGPDYPVENVSWREAMNFCVRRGARLPTEAEWEYAARGPEGWVYPWGNQFEAGYLTHLDNPTQTMPVGSRPANASWVGAYDMSGNVWEWTSSQYQPYPYDKLDGREGYRDLVNYRVVRGGSWRESEPSTFAGFGRGDLAPNGYYTSVGFRCVRDYSGEPALEWHGTRLPPHCRISNDAFEAINIRPEPSTSTPRIAIMRYQQAAIVYDIEADADGGVAVWFLIRYPDDNGLVIGWVRADYVVQITPCIPPE